MALDVDDLRTFLEVRARGSLTAAAKALGSSQPTLTAAMQRLERHFDTTLLVRGRTGVTLTATGLALAHDAQRILEAVGEAQRRVAGIEDTETGRFVLGSHESLAAYFLPSMLNVFFAAHPGIEIDLWNGSLGGGARCSDRASHRFCHRGQPRAAPGSRAGGALRRRDRLLRARGRPALIARAPPRRAGACARTPRGWTHLSRGAREREPALDPAFAGPRGSRLAG
jgi:DNA-binding transcriptional LysR family regulator